MNNKGVNLEGKAKYLLMMMQIKEKLNLKMMQLLLMP